jgi:outer membrane immunogenic protein
MKTAIALSTTAGTKRRGKMLSLRNGVVAIVLAVVPTLSIPAAAQTVSKVEAAFGYSFVHSNAPPGDCGCFSLNGGTGSVAYYFKDYLGAVAEISGQTATNIGSSEQDLTLTSYLFGSRYRWRPQRKLVPFGQVLVGAAHSSNSLATGTGGNTGSANVFAASVGGGVDITLTSHIALRPAELDYYLTRFYNRSNDHQNNLRYSGGIIFRFGGR